MATGSPFRHLTYFGVRFEPSGVERMVAALSIPKPSEAQLTEPADEDVTKPRIQDDWLKAWAEVLGQAGCRQGASATDHGRAALVG